MVLPIAENHERAAKIRESIAQVEKYKRSLFLRFFQLSWIGKNKFLRKKIELIHLF